MAGSILFLDITVDDDQPDEGLSRLLAAVRPQWDLKDVSRFPLVGGCINAMHCCYEARDIERSDAIIVRIYQGAMAEVLDRDKEFLSMQVAHASGCHAPLYAVFKNGLVYKYVSGHRPSLYDLQEPNAINKVARSLFRLHQTDVTSVDLLDRKGNTTVYDHTVDNFSRVKVLAKAIPSKSDNPDLEEIFRCYRADYPDDVIHQEIEFVIGILQEARLPLGFIHGDIHVNNMVMESSGQVQFIDFETSCISYRYFDLGYFFVMWRVSPWIDFSKPGDPALTPEVRQQYLDAYLQAKCENEGRDLKDVTPEEWELMDLQHQVIEFVSFLEITIETLTFVNEPSVPSKFLYFHTEAKDTYFRLKATIKDVIARIQELDTVVNDP